MSATPKQSAGKYMDITHPAHVRPSATSKPVIVGNRPMLAADPMIAESAERAAAHKPTAPALPDPHDSQFREKRVEPEISLEAPTVASTSEERDEQPQKDSSRPPVASVTLAPDDATVQQHKPVVNAESEAFTSEKDARTLERPKSTVDDKVTVASSIETATDIDSNELSPEAIATARSQQYIADGTYFLPIGQAKHRGQRMLFGVCLIIVLLILVLDALLDTGIINLTVPHTTFFR